jgi:colanic acid biosynthesis glycosyl transferase WcaI
MNLPDLHLLTQDAAAGDLVLPSKLAALLASSRPVLPTAERDAELHALLEGAAILIPPGRPDALAQAIIAAMSRKPDLPRVNEVSALFTRERNLPSLCDAIWS